MKLGIIGGSGLYDLEGLEQVEQISVDTPFGTPSDLYTCGFLNGKQVCFLPRHGRAHTLLPHELNHRANIYGFKSLGVERLLSVSAVGSLREDFRPGDIVLPDQYVDRTKASARHTFFGNGVAAHIGFAHPVCGDLLKEVEQAIQACTTIGHPDIRLHSGGTYVNMEGPAFSTQAESHMYQKLGFDIIGMTSLAEAKLCREAELCYACMAMVTDYDCWREEEEAVSVEMVIQTLLANVALAREIVLAYVSTAPDERSCTCPQALSSAIMTHPDAIPEQTKKDLSLLIGKYIK